MQKKAQVGETIFAGRSFLSVASEEDEDINLLSQVFCMDSKQIIRPPMLKEAYSVSNRALLQGGITPAERRVQDFLSQITQLERQDQEHFMAKLENITKEANIHFQSMSNSPQKLTVGNADFEEQESGNVLGSLILKLKEVENKQSEDLTPFKDATLKSVARNENIDEEEEDCNPSEKN